MNVEMINDDIVEEYLDLLTSEEVFGCSNGRISCFGAYDEDTGEPMGVLTAEIFPEYIRIKRIYGNYNYWQMITKKYKKYLKGYQKCYS